MENTETNAGPPCYMCTGSLRSHAAGCPLAPIAPPAPVEPAKHCICQHGPHTSDGKCPVHVTAGIAANGFVGCACDKCMPAPKAPMAASVCTNGRDCLSPKAPVLVRVLRDERQPMCDRCYLALEVDLGMAMRANAKTGTPYTGPERLHRPALARDELVEGDCWPEGSR